MTILPVIKSDTLEMGQLVIPNFGRKSRDDSYFRNTFLRMLRAIDFSPRSPIGIETVCLPIKVYSADNNLHSEKEIDNEIGVQQTFSPEAIKRVYAAIDAPIAQQK